MFFRIGAPSFFESKVPNRPSFLKRSLPLLFAGSDFIWSFVTEWRKRKGKPFWCQTQANSLSRRFGGGPLVPCPYEVFPARSWISGASGKCAMPAPKPQARTQQQVKQGISNFRSRIPQMIPPKSTTQWPFICWASHTQVEGTCKAVI